MIKAKTMTHWENENYDYPLPDVSHFSKKEAKKLKIRMSINTYPAAIFVRKCKKMQPTDLTVAGCGVCMMLPGTILPPGMGVLFFLGYTSVIFRFKRNFSHPTVHCFFNVGNSPVSS